MRAVPGQEKASRWDAPRPDQVSLEQAQQSARLAALAVIASVEGAVEDLDRIDALPLNSPCRRRR